VNRVTEFDLADVCPVFRPAWRRSARGNLIRGWPDGSRLTIFRRPWDGRYGWSIAAAGKVRYSPTGYPSDKAAQRALLETLEG